MLSLLRSKRVITILLAATALFMLSSRFMQRGDGMEVQEKTIGRDLLPLQAHLPSTVIQAHDFGWTVFDHVYYCAGTWNILSTGVYEENDDENVKDREPTDEHLQIITLDESRMLWGPIKRVDGVSFVLNDPKQFLQHYYHFAGEMFLGLWRTYSSLDLDIDAQGHTSLPMPRRIIFPYTLEWDDYSGMNSFVLQSAFPSVEILDQEDVADLAESGLTFVFDRMVMGDRSSADRGQTDMNGDPWRVTTGAIQMPGSLYWWKPVRGAILQAIGADVRAIDSEERPVITYISRQTWYGRMLRKSHHEALVTALETMAQHHKWELNIVSMEDHTREQQIILAARTTVMLGVHGNGLTHLMWMNQANPKATVLEIFVQDGFTRDYQVTAQAFGIKHYGLWEDRWFTAPDMPSINFPPGFQEGDITVDPELVVGLIEERLGA